MLTETSDNSLSFSQNPMPTPHPNPKGPVLMKYSALIHRRNKQACEHAIHKATGKRNSVMLVNLLNLLRDTRQSGGENY